MTFVTHCKTYKLSKFQFDTFWYVSFSAKRKKITNFMSEPLYFVLINFLTFSFPTWSKYVYKCPCFLAEVHTKIRYFTYNLLYPQDLFINRLFSIPLGHLWKKWSFKRIKNKKRRNILENFNNRFTPKLKCPYPSKHLWFQYPKLKKSWV